MYFYSNRPGGRSDALLLAFSLASTTASLASYLTQRQSMVSDVVATASWLRGCYASWLVSYIAC